MKLSPVDKYAAVRRDGAANEMETLWEVREELRVVCVLHIQHHIREILK